jgi:AcrR family transcriptional regulator
MAKPPDPVQRADARRNREKLLEAARERFTAEGTDVSLEAVAKAAGVGIGTLYRHFPNRDALIEAAYRAEVGHLSEAADELLAAHAPDEALARWMDRFVGYASAKKGMRGALNGIAASGSDVYAATRAEIVAALGRLLAAAVAAGTVRADMDAEDVFKAMGSVWIVDDEAQARRLLALLMDGLRHRAG